MSAQPALRVHVWVRGRVQGVFFRQETAVTARRRGVAGWVRNLPDGRVEAVFEGERASVEAMLAWVRSGPPLAAVEEVEIREENPQGEPGFRIES